MPRGWLGPSRAIGHRATPPGVTTAQPTATSSSLVPKYPAALDTPPVAVDGDTVLSAIFHNFVSLMIEAIEGEIGILARSQDATKWVGGRPSLMHVLDQLTFTTGANAGKLLGVGRFWISQAGTSFNAHVATTLTNPSHGLLPASGDPIAFFTPLQLVGLTDDDMRFGPTCVRGSAQFSGSNILVGFHAHRADDLNTGGGARPVTSAKTFGVDGLIFYMPQQ